MLASSDALYSMVVKLHARVADVPSMPTTRGSVPQRAVLGDVRGLQRLQRMMSKPILGKRNR